MNILFYILDARYNGESEQSSKHLGSVQIGVRSIKGNTGLTDIDAESH